MILEVIGLLLAVIDFSGQAPKLERQLEVVQKNLYDFVLFLGRAEKRTQGYSKSTDRKITFILGTCALLGGLVFLIYANKAVPHNPYPTETTGDIVLLLIGFILGLAFSCLLVALVLYMAAIGLFYFCLWPLALVLHLMSKPRTGIVGSFGLLLALAGVLEKVVRR